MKADICFFTVAPKTRFIVYQPPQYGGKVTIVSACSGHGAKHSPAMGEALAKQLLLGLDKSPIDVVDLFEPNEKWHRYFTDKHPHYN